jgi:hypothetical protein
MQEASMTAIRRLCILGIAVGLGGCLGQATTESGDQPADTRAAEVAAEAERFAAQAEGSEVAWAGEPSQGNTTAPPPIPPTVRRTELVAPPDRNPHPTPTVTVEPTDPPAPQVITVTREMTDEQMLAALADQLTQQTRGANASLKPWLARAALAAIDPKYELSATELVALSEEDRRIVKAYQRLFAQIGQSTGRTSSADRQMLEDLAEELADAVDQRKPLTIRNLKLCKKVNGFGVYEAFAKNTFLAGQAHPMIIYAELDHFRSDVGANGKNRVRLTQEVVLYNDSDGLPVWRQRPVAISDESYNQREDFFVVQVIRLSNRLTVGKYQLKVTITDEVGKSVDEATIPVQIVADAALTKP